MRKWLVKLLCYVLIGATIWISFGIAKIAGAYAHTSCDGIEDIKFYTNCKVYNKWSYSEISAFYSIVHKESGWTHNKAHYHDYHKRSATGLMGFLNSTWSTVGCERTYDKRRQIECGIRYIENNYGTPTIALKFHQCTGICYDPRTGGTIKKETTWY